ncbi:MAG: protein kinase family protein [Verrucomicrobia bacterium]|nr:protein kinase family protein [Verrucomicrobiota bacterium]
MKPLVAAPPRKGYSSLMVLLALGALAWLVYYLYKKSLILSERAQAIRDSLKHCPPYLLPDDLDKAARVVESLENQAQSIRNSLRITADKTVRFQIKLFSYFDLLSPIKKKLIIELGPQRTWRVQCIISKLGRGSYGKVVQLFDLHTGQQTAFKIATPAKLNKNNPQEWTQANQDLNKEHINLMTVHRESRIPPPGIQDKPLSMIIILIKVTSSLENARLAYEGTVYNGSLDKLVFRRHLSFKARLHIALQMLRGLEILHAKKFIHHDLKLQNILFRQSPTALQVHVSDLGGVTHEDQLSQVIDSGMAHTPAFTNTFRISLASMMPTDSTQKYCVQKAEECSVGLTLCSILTGIEVTKVDYDAKHESIWSTVRDRKKYEPLISKIDNYIRRNIVISFLNANIHELKEMVEKFHQECTV